VDNVSTGMVRSPPFYRSSLVFAREASWALCSMTKTTLDTQMTPAFGLLPTTSPPSGDF
ncbi:Uncharacterized protein FKW44_016474, partial [Caligus rogercresseyi]